MISYEHGQPLPKKKYQSIFDSLFSDYSISSGKFKERLDMCETFLKNGLQYESIDYLSRRADRASELVNNIRQSIRYDNLDADLYEFINLLICNYSDDVFYNLVQYFLMLYGKKDVSQVNDLQVAYFSELYHAFNKINRNEITFNLLDWKDYKEKCKRDCMKEKLGDLMLQQEHIKKQEYEIRRQLYGNTIWEFDL